MKGRIHAHVQTDGMCGERCGEDYELFSPIINEDEDEKRQIETNVISNFNKTSAVTGASGAHHDIIHVDDRYIENDETKKNAPKITVARNEEQQFPLHYGGNMITTNESTVDVEVRKSKISYSDDDNGDCDDDCMIARNMARIILEESKDLILVAKNEIINSRGGDDEEKITRNIISGGYCSDPER